jgi:hypothetical protein
MPKRHTHQWVFSHSRTNLLGEVYDVYVCTVDGCTETDERRK